MHVAEAIVALDRPVLLALDVDGTLSPIVDNPDAATVPQHTLQSLQRLQRKDGLELALITGRDFSALERMVPDLPVWRATSHGARTFAPGQAPAPEQPRSQRLIDLESWLTANTPDAHLEIKDEALAVHVRAVQAQDEGRAERLLAAARQQGLDKGLVVREGRAMVEFTEQPADKSIALKKIAEATDTRSIVFAGDDLTDMAAIELAAERGIGIFVQSEERPRAPGNASYEVDDVNAMAELLAAIAQAW